jgi:hypothetical protein
LLNNIVALLESGAGGGGGAYESIATVSVGSGGASAISFTGISSDYKHLQIRGLARQNIGGGTTKSPILVAFNSDSGTNYTYHRLIGNGTSVSAGGEGTGSFGACFINDATVGSAVASGIFAASIIDIHDYSSTTKNKTVRTIAGVDGNTGSTSFGLTLMSNLWTSTSAITSITITDYSSRNFAQYTTFALYGIKGA